MPDGAELPVPGRPFPWRVLTGLILLAVVAAGVAWPVTWQRRQAHAQARAVHSAAAIPGRPGCQSGRSQILSIDRTGLLAPVREGTNDAVLAVAVGHDPATPKPGAAGVSMLLAHDVGYFQRLPDLHVGDIVKLSTGCTTNVFTVTRRRITEPGAAVAVPAGGRGLTLVTCWPTNALWWTNERFVVETTLTATVHNGTTRPVPSSLPHYHAPIPLALTRAGTGAGSSLTLSTLTVRGHPARQFVQSPAPLAAEHAALAVLFAGQKAVTLQRSDWWTAIAEPGVPMPSELPTLRTVRVVQYVIGTTVRTVVLADGASSVTVRFVGTTARIAGAAL